jgi:formylglycine-generating enzyme required for sulfatase activity
VPLLAVGVVSIAVAQGDQPDFAPGTLASEPCLGRPGQGPEMVLIESGRLSMGSPEGEKGRSGDEGPQHPVAVVKPFALARCETRVGEFRRFVEETGYLTDAERGGGCYTLKADGSGGEQRADASWRTPGFPQDDIHPVVCVSFNDARAYARWLSLRTGAAYRLPTEAEWEYVARAGSTTSRFWGDDPDAACIYANGADKVAKARFPDWMVADCDDGALFTAPAGSYRHNPYGLSDMLGNVWEWVEDCWHDSYQGAPSDGAAWLETDGGDCARRVLRGGGWNFIPWYLRSANRFRFTADDADDFVGLRLARTL